MILSTLSVEEFKSLYARNLPQRGPDGKMYDDGLFIGHIRSAAASLERELGVVLTAHPERIYQDRLDAIEWDGETWTMKFVKPRPIVSVEAFSYQVGDHAERTIPVSWVRASEPIFGQIQIIPGKASAEYLGPLMYWWNTQRWRYTPLLLKIRHKAGFAHRLPNTVTTTKGSDEIVLSLHSEPTGFDEARDIYSRLGDCLFIYYGGTAHRIVDILNDTTVKVADIQTTTSTYSENVYALRYTEDMRAYIYMKAALPILEQVAAYMYGAPGVSSKSLGLDALSQGRGISTGRGYGPLSAIIEQYKAEAQSKLSALLDEFGPIHITQV
jgi:hypothetical protein